MQRRIQNCIPSHVYVISLSSMEMKVGRSNNPIHRCKKFRSTHPYAKLIYSSELRNDSTYIERLAHLKLKKWKIVDELFAVPAEIAVEKVQEAIAQADTEDYEVFGRGLKRRGKLVPYKLQDVKNLDGSTSFIIVRT